MRARVLAKTRRNFLIFLLIPVAVFLFSACDESDFGSATVSSYFDVDPLFREFYDHLGGLDILGPAISPLFSANDVKYQYTSASLMVHNPQSPASKRFSLGALGLDMGISEPSLPQPTNPDLWYVGGHIVYSDFVRFYEKLGGEHFAGRPITEMHYNPETTRYEQFFENVGLYRLEGEPADRVHLLAYGAWKCGASCQQIPISNNLVVIPPKVGEQFSETVTSLGPDFTGFPLSDPAIGPDGLLEQVFENMVLVVDPNAPGSAAVYPITQKLGIFSEPMGFASGDQDLVFYPIQNERGYNIPKVYIDYLKQHGGIDIAGPPVGELSRLTGQLERQCFTNLCLDVRRTSSGAQWISPAPLGYTYRYYSIRGFNQAAQQTQPQEDTASQPPADPAEPADPAGQAVPLEPAPPVEPTQIPPEEQPAEANSLILPSSSQLSIQVWETYPMVGPDQAQEIGVGIFENNLPVKSVEPDLVVTFPDGGTKTYYMYPTGDDGQTRMEVDPVNAPNGTLVPYEVCILNPNGERLCVKDSFLVWQNP